MFSELSSHFYTIIYYYNMIPGLHLGSTVAGYVRLVEL